MEGLVETEAARGQFEGGRREEIATTTTTQWFFFPFDRDASFRRVARALCIFHLAADALDGKRG